jgi:EAL domain-containing protein (putative c-di-GMP-specific phosphodiesterase class I)/GGDEF domain-containing protein
MIDRRATLAGWAADPALAPVRSVIDVRIAAAQPVSVVLISLSRVDIVNAAYGRPTGDALIAAVGGAIAALARDVGATMAPMGGVEFALTLPSGVDAAVDTTKRLTELMAEPFTVGTIRALVGSRIGFAEALDGDDGARLLRRTREALTAAKASDGTTIRIAQPDGIAPLDELAVDLHHAIDRHEIDIRFQPQVSIPTGRIIGVEALARWDHGQHGEIGAEMLFAAADRADLGVALSDHIQQLVLARAARWGKTLGSLRVALNLTAADVTRPGFAALFLARVDASGFPRGRLTIEITETGLIEDLQAVAALLAELRGAGCRVAIDDFGTGYSSLAYLKSLPLDYLKIDKSLTSDIDGSPRDRVVVRGVIDIARSLGVAVIAEGVETSAQLNLLAADGCDFYQGFLLAGPLDEAALKALVEKQ